MDKYINYINTFDYSEKVEKWIKSNLKNYLEKNKEGQSEIEHILDYLLIAGTEKNIELMSYDEAKKNAEKWTKQQIKRGEHIKESIDDVEVIHDFKDGFKIVRLIGKNAYKREGYLMSNCVASYYGNGKEIYSLRDANNNPHCTMEKDQQVKGRGNGNVHPKYVGYVVKFLEIVGMTVGDSEMSHLGYLNVSRFKKYLHKDTKFFNKVYVYEQDKLLDKDGNEFASLDLLDVKPLIEADSETEIKINFDLKTFVPLSIDFLLKHKKSKTTGNSVAKGYFSTAASSGNSSTAASSGDSSTAASSGNSSTAASSGNSSKAASSGNSSTAASSGNSSKAASSGDFSKAASLGNRSQASAEGEETIACALGAETKAKGKIGTWLVLSEYSEDWQKILAIKSVKVDGKKIKEDTWYELKNKKFVEVEA